MVLSRIKKLEQKTKLVEPIEIHVLYVDSEGNQELEAVYHVDTDKKVGKVYPPKTTPECDA